MRKPGSKRNAADFTRARRELEAIRDLAPQAIANAAQKIGPIARSRVADEWPVDTKRSKNGWKWETSTLSLVNPVEYSPWVHDELHKRLVPKVFRELRPLFDFIVSEELKKLARRAAKAA